MNVLIVMLVSTLITKTAFTLILIYNKLNGENMDFISRSKGFIRFAFWRFFSMCFLFVQNFFYHIYYKGKYKLKESKTQLFIFILFTLVTFNLACLVHFWRQAKEMLPKIYRISQYPVNNSASEIKL